MKDFRKTTAYDIMRYGSMTALFIASFAAVINLLNRILDGNHWIMLLGIAIPVAFLIIDRIVNDRDPVTEKDRMIFRITKQWKKAHNNKKAA